MITLCDFNSFSTPPTQSQTSQDAPIVLCLLIFNLSVIKAPKMYFLRPGIVYLIKCSLFAKIQNNEDIVRSFDTIHTLLRNPKKACPKIPYLSPNHRSKLQSFISCKVCSSYGPLAYFFEIFISGKNVVFSVQK